MNAKQAMVARLRGSRYGLRSLPNDRWSPKKRLRARTYLRASIIASSAFRITRGQRAFGGKFCKGGYESLYIVLMCFVVKGIMITACHWLKCFRRDAARLRKLDVGSLGADP